MNAEVLERVFTDKAAMPLDGGHHQAEVLQQSGYREVHISPQGGAGGNIEEQAAATLHNIDESLRAASERMGGIPSDLTQVTVMVARPEDFGLLNRVYLASDVIADAESRGGKPTRFTVIGDEEDMHGRLVVVSARAALRRTSKGSSIIEGIHTEEAPEPVADAYRQGVGINGDEGSQTILTSGQLGFQLGTTTLVGGGVRGEAGAALGCAGKILDAGGAGGRVSKVDVVVAPKDRRAFGTVYRQWGRDPLPQPQYMPGRLLLGAAVEVAGATVIAGSKRG
jgi:enamine deaminase RidA (YjgF/YER057c/UK114 family)